jgi:hypothetical protein
MRPCILKVVRYGHDIVTGEAGRSEQQRHADHEALAYGLSIGGPLALRDCDA